MDGQVFSHSLFSLKGNNLRSIYALLCKTNSMKLISSKTLEFLSVDEQDHLRKHHSQIVKELEDRSEDKLRFQLFIEITSILELKGINYSSAERTEQQSENIIEEMYKLVQNQEKEFEQNHQLKASTKLQKLIVFQIERLFKELYKLEKDVPIEVNPMLTVKLIHYIEKQPIETQEQIKNRWALTMINAKSVEELINRKNIEWLLTDLKEAEGFSFYIQFAPDLFSLLSSMKSQGMVVYQNKVLDPSITSYLLGFNQILWSLHYNDIKKRLLPIVIMQMMIVYLLDHDHDEEVYYASFIEEWGNRTRKYRELKANQLSMETKQAEIKELIQSINAQLEQMKTNISKCVTLIERDRASILTDLKTADLHQLEISPSFNEHRAEYHSVQERVHSIKRAQGNYDDQGSLLKRVSHSVTNIYRGFNLNEEEKKLDNLLKQMAADVVKSNSPFKQKERENITRLLTLYKQLNRQKMDEETNKFNLEQELANLTEQHSMIRGTIVEFEEETYGIKDIPLSSSNPTNEKTNRMDEQQALWQKKLAFLHNFEQKLKKLKEQNQNALENLAYYESRIESVTEELGKKQEELDRVTPYQKHAEQLELEKNELIKQNEQLKEAYHKELQTQFQKQQSEWQYKYEDLKLAAEEQIQKQASSLNGEWQEKYAELERVSREKQKHLTEEMEQLSHSNHELTQSLETLQQQLKEKDGFIQSLVDQRNDMDNQQSRLEEQVRQIEREKEELIKRNQEISDQNEKLADQTSKTIENKNQVAELSKQYQKKLEQQEQEKQKLMDSMERMDADHKTATDQLLTNLNTEWEQKILEVQQSHTLQTEQKLLQIDKQWTEKQKKLTESYETKIQELTQEIEAAQNAINKTYFEGELFDIGDL